MARCFEVPQSWRIFLRARWNWNWSPAVVQRLRQAQPVPWQQLHHTLVVLQDVAAATGGRLSPAEARLPATLAQAAARLPPATLIHLPWALNQMTEASGYIPATAQEALLQIYLGERLAARTALLADQWRQTQSASTTAAANTNAAPASRHVPEPARPVPSAAEIPTPAPDQPGQHPRREPNPPGSPSSSTSGSSSSASSGTSAHEAPNTPSPAQESPQSHPDMSSDIRRFSRALVSLDALELQPILRQKTFFFQQPPQFLRGRVRQALSFACACIIQANTATESTRAWKLFLLLPRLLLQRKPGQRLLPKPDWRRRIEQFQAGEWLTLLQESTPAPEDGNPAPAPTGPDLQRRAQRARHLVQMGELSAARQALTAGPTAPGTHGTLEELRDPARRPPEPYQPLSPEVSNFQPDQPIQLPAHTIVHNLRKSKRGAAPGPSGLTSDTLRLVLDDEEATQRLTAVAESLARADVPPSIIPCLGLGRMVALQKPNGRVRGIIIGDVLRRLVSRSLAQTYAEAIHTACSPHQFALSTRAGTEAIIHTITAATQANPAHTVVSVDGIGAYDTISRESMLQGLMAVPAANRSLPFVRMFYGQPSEYVWHDDQGHDHIITQAEGGEQGDPFMPALFSLGQKGALQAIQRQLHPTELLLAFLDDIYAVVMPGRARTVYDITAHELSTRTGIQLNGGKTRVWNAAGTTPPNLGPLGPNVWVGDRSLPSNQQGLTILGTPIGSPQYVAHQLELTTASHHSLLERIPALEDLQSS